MHRSTTPQFLTATGATQPNFLQTAKQHTEHAGKQKTNRWLAEQMGKSENTISRWCSNKSQPSIAQLQEIANLLDVDVRVLLKSQKE